MTFLGSYEKLVNIGTKSGETDGLIARQESTLGGMGFRCGISQDPEGDDLLQFLVKDFYVVVCFNIMSTKKTGDITESQVIAHLIKNDKQVFVPFGDNTRYDLAVDENGRIIRIQCKTGNLAERQDGHVIMKIFRNGEIGITADC